MDPLTSEEIPSSEGQSGSERVRTALIQSRLHIAVLNSKAQSSSTVHTMALALDRGTPLVIMIDDESSLQEQLHPRWLRTQLDIQQTPVITYGNRDHATIETTLMNIILDTYPKLDLDESLRLVTDGRTREAAARLWLKVEASLIKYSINRSLESGKQEYQFKEPKEILKNLMKDNTISEEISKGILNLYDIRYKVVRTSYIPNKKEVMKHLEHTKLLLESLKLNSRRSFKAIERGRLHWIEPLRSCSSIVET